MTEGESGASMPAAIVGIALMAMVVGLGAQAVRTTVGVAEQLLESARFQATLARFDSELVLAAARIRQPVWLGHAEFRARSNELSISYLDGDPAGRLFLRWDEAGVSLVTGSTSSEYRGLSIANATVDPRPPAHIAVGIETAQNNPIVVTAPFALSPLPQQ